MNLYRIQVCTMFYNEKKKKNKTKTIVKTTMLYMGRLMNCDTWIVLNIYHPL